MSEILKKLDLAPSGEDVEVVFRDLVYCISQAFALTQWTKDTGLDADFTVALVNWPIHDALLGISLLNIRILDDFIYKKPKKIKGVLGADIVLEHLRELGFANPVDRILTDEESRVISQLFAHLTANRNPTRFEKSDFTLTKFLTATVKAYDPILEFFELRLQASDVYRSEAIGGFRSDFRELLRFQIAHDKAAGFRGPPCYRSGSVFPL